MKTNSNITSRALMTSETVVRQPSAFYQSAAAKRDACPGTLPAGFNGGGFLQWHAFTLEGGLRLDRHQNQI